jgi:hypothetical protein
MWIIWGITWAVHLALWLAYVDQLSLHELLVGSVAAAIAVLGYAAVWKHGHVPFTPRWRDLLQFWRMPWYAASGTWEILHGLAQQLFRPGGAPSVTSAAPIAWDGEDSHAIARRALAITYTTLTPNFIVIDVVAPSDKQERGTMLYHQILPGPIITMTHNLGVEEQ